MNVVSTPNTVGATKSWNPFVDWLSRWTRPSRTRRRRREATARSAHQPEALESRLVMSSTPMQIGINLDNVRDYQSNWMFTDAFQHSRPWVSHSYNTVTRQLDFNGGSSVAVAVDEHGWPEPQPTANGFAAWTTAQGQAMQQRVGTLMFREIAGNYPAGEYRVEWEGTGDIVFGMDARETSRGITPEGQHFATLTVVPSNAGIYLGIASTTAGDPVRDIHVWMPDYNGQSFAGQRWQPGADFSPFHPLYKERIDDFGILRFMQPQETNTSDIRSWSDRRDSLDASQNSGLRGPMANGLSVEYMVQLANELDADPWFNMPHMADDLYVQNFATYVRDNLEPGRTVYVEWSNEVWNNGSGFEAGPWIAQQVALPENSGVTTWQFVAREMRRDFDIWSSVFVGQTDRLVRSVGAQAVNPWVAERILENMNGRFDAIAIAPYLGLSPTQRASYTPETTLDQVFADLNANLDVNVQMTLNHQRLADDYSRTLNRDIRLLAYEGGPALEPGNTPLQSLLLEATSDPRMESLTREYLRRQNAAGLDAYVHYRYTGRDVPSAYGQYGVLTSQDQPVSEAHVYRTLLEADAGGLFTNAPTYVTASAADPTATEQGRASGVFRLTRGGDLSLPVTVNYTLSGTATSGVDYVPLSGRVTFPLNENTVYIAVNPIDDATIELAETVVLTVLPSPAYTLLGDANSTATLRIISNDFVAGAPVVSLFATDATASEANRDPGTFSVVRSDGDLTRPLTVWLEWGPLTATASDVDPVTRRVDFAPNQTTATITIRPIDDTVLENRESVILMLDPNTPQYRVGNRMATINILDNDGAPAVLPEVSLTVLDGTASEAEHEPGTILISRTGPTTQPLVVGYSVGGGATNNFDYDGLGGIVVIPAGQSSTTLTVRPIDDGLDEADELVVVQLNPNAAYTLGAAGGAGVVIADDDAPGVETLPVLIVVANRDFYYQEYHDPRIELEARGIPVVVAAGRREFSMPHSSSGQGDFHGNLTPDIALDDVNAADYSAIVFVGGWGVSQYQYAFPGTYTNNLYNGTPEIRNRVNELINEFVEQDKYVTGVCHGVSVLAWARIDGQSPLQGRTVTTAVFNSPTNNVPGANMYRWHSEVNGATVLAGGSIGDPTTDADDVWIDGQFITAQNHFSARLFGQTLASRLLVTR